MLGPNEYEIHHRIQQNCEASDDDISREKSMK